jgi:hypothetical protein
MTKAKLSRAEADGRRVASYCNRKPRSMLEIRYQLSDDVLIPLSRAKRAVDWCKAQRLTTLNPFLCVLRDGSYLYGFRSVLYPDVTEFLHHELRYLDSRLGTAEAVIEHVLTTAASLSVQVGPSERVMLNRWRRILSGQLAAAEQVSAELDELLTA